MYLRCLDNFQKSVSINTKKIYTKIYPQIFSFREENVVYYSLNAKLKSINKHRTVQLEYLCTTY